MISAGALNRYATLSRPTETSDGQGGQTVTWTQYGTAYVFVESMSSSERLRAAQMTAVSMTQVTTWFRDDVSVKDRVTLESVTMEVTAITPTWSNGARQMTLDCIEADA